MTLPRRNAVRHNYAQINHKGFNSTKSLRNKKIIRKRKVTSVPTSPMSGLKNINKNSSKEVNLIEVASKLQQLRDGDVIMSSGANAFVASPRGNNSQTNNSQANKSVKQTDKRQHDLTKAGANANHGKGDLLVNNSQSIHASSGPVQISSINNSEFIADSNPDMSSLQEKKKQAMAEIERMEAELRELESDEELAELRKRQKELKQRLEKKRTSTTPESKVTKRTSKKRVKKGETSEGEMGERLIRENEISGEMTALMGQEIQK